MSVMNKTLPRRSPELSALLDACCAFDYRDRDRRMFIRSMVLPLLARKQDEVRVALRAKPESRSIQTMIEEIRRAIQNACRRLIWAFDPVGAPEDAQEEIRREIVLAVLGLRKKPQPGKRRL